MKKIQFIIIPTILSFGLIISSALISNALDKVNKNENRITVKGVAERRIKADKALINIVISKKSENLDELKKDISEREKLIINLIRNLKIGENEYSIGNLRIQPNYVDSSLNNTRQSSENSSLSAAIPGTSNKISDYNGVEVISIITKNIDKTEEFYRKLAELKLQRNNIEVNIPEYYITNLERYKKDLVVDASRNAEIRAIEMLKVNNNEIGGLKNMNQGQFELLEDTEDVKKINEDESNQIYKKLRLVVTATYLIKY
ncbi:SIMPL domain-containing protein [Leptotrichia alba]|uniref:SIMPL domain-containing protein n=1 Tax=Leptotrichia alba TaxID=3239304 RepID=A0AB39V201_9FUSO